MTLPKVSAAIGSILLVPNDTDCIIIECNEAVGGFSDNVGASEGAAHAEKPKGVSSELMKKIWRIDESTAKRSINTSALFCRQDSNSRLYRNCATNDRMLRYCGLKFYHFHRHFLCYREGYQPEGLHLHVNTCLG